MYRTIERLLDRNSEPFFIEYRPHLRELTKILVEYPVVEGNIFGHHNTDPRTYPRKEFKDKRQNLSLFALTRSNVLEIGFNAGHSAMLLLTANPNLKYTAIDLCCNPYVLRCYDYLKSVFADRIELIQGNSSEKLPELLAHGAPYDGYIIDGDHTTEVTYSDLLNTVKYSTNGSVVCVDDVGDPKIRLLVNYFMMQGTLVQIVDNSGFISCDSQMFFRVIK